MENLTNVIESILFVAGDSVAFFDIADKLQIEIEEVKSAVEQLKKEKEESGSGIQVLLFNGKAQLCSNPDYATQVSEVLNPIKEKALTKAVLEVAAIIAYKQPITRLEVENVRGVNSDYAINALIEGNLIEIVGRKDAVGKPLLFGTTDNFLKKFSLNSLEDLPAQTLKQIEYHFNHYKDLKKPGSTEVKAFEDAKSAKKVVAAAVERYLDAHPELRLKKGVEDTVEAVKKAIKEA